MPLPHPPEEFHPTLLRLQKYYAALAEEHERLYRQALESLNHVEALLSNWQDADSPQEVDNSNNVSVVPEADPNREVTLSSQTIAFTVENSPKIINQESVDNSNNASKLLESNATDSSHQEESQNSHHWREKLNGNATNTSSRQEELPASTKLFHGQEIPMLKEYQSLERVEAIQQLLQKNTGIVCHIDFVIRSLYGELEADTLKVVKHRVQSTLTRGKRSGKWSVLPDEPGCYTIDLKLIDSPRQEQLEQPESQEQLEQPESQEQVEQPESQEQQEQVESQEQQEQVESQEQQEQPESPNKSNQTETNNCSLKGEFEGQIAIDAISSLLEQNPRKVFEITEIIYKLYGELEPEQMREIRPKIRKDLSRGYQAGRFSKVPGEKGLYLWDARLLPVEVRS